MLSYQHHYHAGNHADVLKHWLLCECLAYMQQKDKAFDYIDTHAGAGLYPLDGKLAKKLNEHAQGLDRLLAEPVTGMELYLEQIAFFRSRRIYPGSATLAKNVMRQQDKSWLFELHPQAFRELQRNCERKQKIHVRQQDGFEGLLSLLPVPSRRALVLIDPAYEIKKEYQQVVDTLKSAHQKMPQTMILLWYPVVNRQMIDRLQSKIISSGIKDVCQFELGVREEIPHSGMSASGLFVINPPWTLKSKVDEVLPKLSRCLAEDKCVRYKSESLC